MVSNRDVIINIRVKKNLMDVPQNNNKVKLKNFNLEKILCF